MIELSTLKHDEVAKDVSLLTKSIQFEMMHIAFTLNYLLKDEGVFA